MYFANINNNRIVAIKTRNLHRYVKIQLCNIYMHALKVKNVIQYLTRYIYIVLALSRYCDFVSKNLFYTLLHSIFIPTRPHFICISYALADT